MNINIELITAALSFLFTLLIFSYLLGDNPLFRIGTYIFVGVTAGYVAAVVIWQVAYPRLLYPLAYGSMTEKTLTLVPFLLAGLLLMKGWPRTSHIGTPAMAYIVGVSAAVTVGGAVIGTIFPQTFATINAFGLIDFQSPLEVIDPLSSGIIILVGLATTLSYFHFGARVSPDGAARRFGFIEILAWVGRIFIAITLGVLFAGVLLASLTAFIERIASWFTFFASF
jgi:hypothetical protein